MSDRKITRFARIMQLIVAAAVVTVIACGEPFVRTNPYDPNVPVTVVVTGPDTLFSAFEVGTFSVQTDPPFADSAIHWGSGSNTSPGRTTTAVNAGPPLWPETFTGVVVAGIGLYDTTLSLGSATIQTEMFRHTGFKTVVYTQRVTHIALRCPDDHACDTVSTGGTWSVWVDGLDAHNQKIYALVGALKNPLTGTPIATFSTRDPSIASVSPIGIRASTVTALRSGSTWIVATRDSLRDSLKLIVR